MHIIFAVVWHIVIDHQVDGIDINTAAEDVCGNEYGNASAGKAIQHVFALRLFQVAVNFGRLYTWRVAFRA